MPDDNKLGVVDFLGLANSLILIAGNIAAQIVALRSLAQAAGATNAELDDLDVRLTAALAARKAEQ